MLPTIRAKLAHLLTKASKAASLIFAYQIVVTWFLKTHSIHYCVTGTSDPQQT